MADVKHNFAQAGLLKRNVLIQKDDYGFGLTVSGDNPVYVQSVKPGSAASKAGVEVGDKIIKVNGTLVTESNHIEVVTLIKSGSYVALTLLGKDNKQQGHNRTRSLTGIIPSLASLQQHPTETQPQPYNTSPSDANKSDRIKDVERTLNQERDYNKTILEKYRRAPSPKTQLKLAESKTRISALEKQLQFLSGTIPDKSAAPYRPVLQPIEPRERPPSHSTPTDVSSLSTRSAASYSQSNISTYTHVDRQDKIDEATQHSNLESSSTPNLRTSIMNPSSRSAMENDIFGGISTIESVAEEVIGELGMDSMKSLFDQARKMENNFGYVQNNSSEYIFSMEDGEFSDEESLDQHGPFESLDLLKDKKAHLAVFLHYLISNSDPTPLFFWVVTEIYSNEQRSDNAKEWKKWGYEIYSTFVAQSAPLKVNIGGDIEEKIIEEALNDPNTTEHRLRNIFNVARSRLKPELEEMLSDFRLKRSIGLGGLFGDRQLEDDMDRAAELKIVETTLMPHLDTLLGDHESSSDIQSDKNFAMACAIATLMKSAGLQGKVSGGKGTSLERCRSFAEKEKSSFMNINKYKKPTKVHHMGHQFQSVQYSSITLCNVCNGLLWGIGIQGLQCQSCEFNVHRKNCLDGIKEMCTKGEPKRKIRAKTDRRTITDGTEIPSFGKKHEEIQSSLGVGETRGSRVPSMTEDKSGTDVDEPERGAADSESDRGTPTPSEDIPTTPQQKSKSLGYKAGRKKDRPKGGAKTPENGHPPSPHPRIESPQPESEEDDFSDFDFDVAQEVPPWSAIVDKKIIKRLKSKEIKRQEVIHELLHTEKTHVRNLKILDKIFYRTIKKSNLLLPEEVNKIFPNLDDLIKIHESLLDQMKERETLNEVIENIGDIMLNTFGGENKEHVKETCATFCRQQKSALLEWRSYRENRKEFAAMMTRLEGNQHCRRLQFAAILASTHQRLVKYPLLLESLNKTTPEFHRDYKNVEKATECCKYILNFVNDEIKRCEDELRLVELSKKIEDVRKIRENENINEGNSEENMENEGPVGKFNILQHKLVLEGDLVWKINLNKKLDLHVVLLNDTLVLLQKQDEKFTLKTHNANQDNKGHSPLIPMSKALIREVATDRKAFFLVSTSTKQPHIYELVAQTHLEKKLWVDNINQAIEVNKVDDISLQGRRIGLHQPTSSQTTSPTPTTPTPTTPTELEEEEEDEEQKVRGNSVISEGQLSDEEDKTNGKEIHSGHSDESDEDEKSSTAHVLSKEKLEELNDHLSENETDLRTLIIKRSSILSELHGEKYNPYNMESFNTGPTKLVISAIEQVEQLQEIFGQFSQSVTEDQRDTVAQSITGLQRYLKDILNVVCTTNRHDSCTDSYDGEKDAERDSKRTSSKTYSSDMTDSLPRHSPLGDAILSTSPPPIHISRTSTSTSQDHDDGVEECVQNHEDLSSAVMSGTEDVSPSKMVEPLSPRNDSPPKPESGVLITSPFKIQKLRKRPSDPSHYDAVPKLTSKVPSFTEQHHTDSSDSEE